MQHTRKIATGLLVAVLLVLASVGGVTAAIAEETSPEDGVTAATPEEKTSPEDGNVFTRGLRRLRGDRAPDAAGGSDQPAFWALLATNLGLERSTVETAAENAKAQWLAEAVAAGTISQATADKLTAFPGHRWGRRHRHGGDHSLPDFIAAAELRQRVAETLGVTVAELEAAEAQGRRGWASLNLEREALRTAVRDALQQLVAEAVAAGTITETEAEAWLQESRWDRWGHRHDGGYPLPDFIAVADLQQRVAENLGVTVEELETAKAQGRTGWASLNIDRASLRTAVREALQQLRDEAVAAGTITQTEAEAWMQDTRWKGHDCSSGLDDDDETVEPNA